jgi:hypothetical protein
LAPADAAATPYNEKVEPTANVLLFMVSEVIAAVFLQRPTNASTPMAAEAFMADERVNTVLKVVALE